MSKKAHDGQEDLVPLNSKLFNDFSIEVLEERLETDPLMLSGLFDEIVPFCDQCKNGDLSCPNTNCADTYCSQTYTCTCDTVDTDLECFKG